MSTTIAIPERFDFSFHKSFTEQYNKILDQQTKGLITLDFSRVLYLDSAALGMIVLLQKRAKANGCNVEVANAKGTALEVLQIANFDKMLTIR
ncbi:STAS domain-containing protein [Alteromonas gilva]|uniref:STAS domain-containing protein n=1 Tax=Alteromonas gilva TaxID=2987522 RepID=A0ABT5KYT7_9ALTE|nr:STAS domain-containing protein [Alteromonas gilva]MDC8829421.1 STAS domain-containing protein [Alteromonas gilva]